MSLQRSNHSNLAEHGLEKRQASHGQMLYDPNCTILLECWRFFCFCFYFVVFVLFLNRIFHIYLGWGEWGEGVGTSTKVKISWNCAHAQIRICMNCSEFCIGPQLVLRQFKFPRLLWLIDMKYILTSTSCVKVILEPLHYV